MTRKVIALNGKHIRSLDLVTNLSEYSLSPDQNRPHIPPSQMKKLKRFEPVEEEEVSISMIGKPQYAVDEITEIKLRPRNTASSRKISDALALFRHGFKAEEEGDVLHYTVFNTTLEELAGFLFEQNILEPDDMRKIANQTNAKARKV